MHSWNSLKIDPYTMETLHNLPYLLKFKTVIYLINLKCSPILWVTFTPLKKSVTRFRCSSMLLFFGVMTNVSDSSAKFWKYDILRYEAYYSHSSFHLLNPRGSGMLLVTFSHLYIWVLYKSKQSHKFNWRKLTISNCINMYILISWAKVYLPQQKYLEN